MRGTVITLDALREVYKQPTPRSVAKALLLPSKGEMLKDQINWGTAETQEQMLRHEMLKDQIDWGTVETQEQMLRRYSETLY